jgi:hypothetical protein
MSPIYDLHRPYQFREYKIYTNVSIPHPPPSPRKKKVDATRRCPFYIAARIRVKHISDIYFVAALARFGRVRCYSWTFLLGGLASAAVAVILWTTERGSQAGGNYHQLYSSGCCKLERGREWLLGENRIYIVSFQKISKFAPCSPDHLHFMWWEG